MLLTTPVDYIDVVCPNFKSKYKDFGEFLYSVQSTALYQAKIEILLEKKSFAYNLRWPARVNKRSMKKAGNHIKRTMQIQW